MKAIVLSASSDIGIELIKSFSKKGYEVFGTYNKTFPNTNHINEENLLKLRISDYHSEKYKKWLEKIGPWDIFVSCIGTQDPVGFLKNIDAKEWVEGVADNSIYQVGALINALKFRNIKKTSNVIFFAGGGTNSPTPAYSAQTLGKISLIKSVELLNDEIEDTKFMILGPGWVKTKIHKSTLNSTKGSNKNYKKTIEMLTKPNMCNPIEKVIDDIYKLIDLPKILVGGRNFSSVHDNLNANKLKSLFEKNVDFYKLRRNLNDA